jgi:hypothetical protein
MRGGRADPRQSTRASDPRRGPKWLAAGPVLKNRDRFFKKELTDNLHLSVLLTMQAFVSEIHYYAEM